MARPSRGFSESIGIWKCWFLRRGENRSTRRKTSRSKDENQQQTQPTFDAESGNRTRATLVGGLRGRQMLNHCAIPAPLGYVGVVCIHPRLAERQAIWQIINVDQE